MLDGCEILLRGRTDNFRRDGEFFANALKCDTTEEVRTRMDESIDIRGCCGLADEISNVDCEEVTRGKKAIDSFETNVIRVAVIRMFPVQCANGGIGGLANRVGF